MHHSDFDEHSRSSDRRWLVWAARTRRLLADPYWSWVKWRANGALRAAAYRRLFHLARTTPDLPFVEVGAGGGAGTIALALGARAAGKQAQVVTVESRDNTPLRRNLARFGVADAVTLYPKKFSRREADDLLATTGKGPFAGFVSDADGQLDRDFAVLWPRVVDGGPIVIDDYGSLHLDALVEEPRNARKLLKTRRAVDFLCAEGILVVDDAYGRTLFAHKPAHAPALRPETIDALRAVIRAADHEMRRRLGLP